MQLLTSKGWVRERESAANMYISTKSGSAIHNISAKWGSVVYNMPPKSKLAISNTNLPTIKQQLCQKCIVATPFTLVYHPLNTSPSLPGLIEPIMHLFGASKRPCHLSGRRKKRIARALGDTSKELSSRVAAYGLFRRRMARLG